MSAQSERDAGTLLVTGGAGAVGRRLSRQLAGVFPGSVVVAGRDPERARRVAQSIGKGARALALDVRDEEAVNRALESARAVVNCVPLREPYALLRSAILHGVAYTDITPQAIWMTALSLAPVAARSGARVVLGAGLAPGASSVMARALVERLGAADSIDVALLFDLGDEFGDAALDTLIGMSARKLSGTREGRPYEFLPFVEARKIDFGPPFGTRRAYRSPFTDQLWFGRTLGARSAATWLALEPTLAGRLLHGFARLRLARALERPSRRRAAIRVIRAATRALRIRGDDIALVVEVRGSGGTGRLALAGHCEPEAAAIATSLVARALLGEQPIAAGVWFPEQVISPAWFFRELDRLGLGVRDAAPTSP